MQSAPGRISQPLSAQPLNSSVQASNDHVGLRRQSAIRREPLGRGRPSGISLFPQSPIAHQTETQSSIASDGPLTPRPQTQRSSSPTASSDSCDSGNSLSITSRDNSSEVDFDRTPHFTQSFASIQAEQYKYAPTMAANGFTHQEGCPPSPAYVPSSGTEKLSPPHAFTNAALYHIGLVEGITPPPMQNTTDASPLSSVVATGLEMGLGVSLATSALRTQGPGVGAAMSGLAEPRFSRPHLSQYETQHERADDPQSPKSSIRSAQSVDVSSHGEGIDSDLHRRRTTGMRIPKSRFEPVRGTRHQRADTHDHILSTTSTTAELEKQQYIQNNYIALRNDPKIVTANLPTVHPTDEPPSASVSLGRNSSIGGQSSTSAHIGSTTSATPSLGDKPTMSPDSQLNHPFAFVGRETGTQAERASWKSAQKRRLGNMNGPTQAALLGLGGGSHFGPGVRAKVSQVLPYLVSSVPLSSLSGETVTIAEYGSLNTRAMNLMQPIISSFVDKAHTEATKPTEAEDHDDVGDAQALDATTSLLNLLGVNSTSEEPCMINFSVIHEDSPQADFRPLSQILDSSSESYLNPQWQASHQPSLQNLVFPRFVARPFASRIAPPSSVHLGISLMDLHWSHTPRNSAVSLSTSAHAELTAFLTARAHEFRKDGVLVMAFIARAEDNNMVLPDRPKSTLYTTSPVEANDVLGGGQVTTDTPEALPAPVVQLRKQRTRSNSSPSRPDIASAGADPGASDIFTTMTNTLAPCLQRLVSCGMLKSDVARHLLSLPMHARTPRQTRNVLKSVRHLWKVDWSCGLGDEASSPDTPSDWRDQLVSESEPLRLPHPAWKALQAGTLSRVAFAEHMIQLFKNLYESHFRVILREKGKLSKGAVEFVLDSLWDVLQSRIDDQEPCPIAQCELEVQVIALRRA